MPAHRTRDISPRSLEVTTDTPQQAPTLAIISPTPRAFTFPINTANTAHLSSSPYSSPSSSPFEPDLRTLAFTPSPPTFVRTLSPVSSITSASSTYSPPTHTHKRRKSSCSDLERRPKKGDEDYIKRPENAFILFRRKCCEDRQAAQEEAASSADGPTKKQRQADLSKTISQQWKSLSAEERLYWEELAKEKKKEHEQLYPNYVYRPQRTKDKDGRSKSKKTKGRRGDDHETDSESVSFVLPWPVPSNHNRHGRSASAPTPPLGYQSIQLPNVYMPSCPTSPSLMPMISRRSSHPGHEDSSSQFDFLPHNTFIPPSFGQASDFEANLQSNEFFQSMFDVSGQSTLTDKSNGSPLHQLTIPQEPSLLFPPNQIISPVSTESMSSSPSSPDHGPFTPAQILSSAFSMAPQENGSGYVAPYTSEQGLSMNAQPENIQAPELQYPSYEWEGQSMWPVGSEIFLGEDFDLNAIPPIELGLSKFNEDVGQSGAPTEYANESFVQSLEESQYQEDSHAHDSSFDGLFGFNDMMAGQGF